MVILAPIVEEGAKFILTYVICLRRRLNDEPIDASIYMLTTALGFAAVDTALYLSALLGNGEVVNTIVAGNYRAVGPMLIHLVSSAMVGMFMGFAFYKSRKKKIFYLLFGFLFAVIIHALFNLFTLLDERYMTLNQSTSESVYFWIACLITWLLVVTLLAFFNKVKQVSRRKSPTLGVARKK